MQAVFGMVYASAQAIRIFGGATGLESASHDFAIGAIHRVHAKN
jgi:hypothetical protein